MPMYKHLSSHLAHFMRYNRRKWKPLIGWNRLAQCHRVLMKYNVVYGCVVRENAYGIHSRTRLLHGMRHQHLALVDTRLGPDVGDLCQMRQSGTRMNAICIYSAYVIIAIDHFSDEENTIPRYVKHQSYDLTFMGKCVLLCFDFMKFTFQTFFCLILNLLTFNTSGIPCSPVLQNRIFA